MTWFTPFKRKSDIGRRMIIKQIQCIDRCQLGFQYPIKWEIGKKVGKITSWQWQNWVNWLPPCLKKRCQQKKFSKVHGFSAGRSNMSPMQSSFRLVAIENEMRIAMKDEMRIAWVTRMPRYRSTGWSWKVVIGVRWTWDVEELNELPPNAVYCQLSVLEGMKEKFPTF